MRKAMLLVLCAALQGLCAKPSSQRIKVAEETLVQARDQGIPYEAMLDAALDKGPAAFERYILLWKKLDTSGAYFHFFHIYEAAEIAGDAAFAAATAKLTKADATLLVQGLGEAHGWLKRKATFTQRFSRSAAQFRKSGIKVDF